MADRRRLNVLLTSVGRRVDVVIFFRAALAGRGLVVACDADPHAPALEFADVRLTAPPVDGRDFLDFLATECRRHDIAVIVPSLEPELAPLAASRERFVAMGVQPVVPSVAVVELCQDKLATAEFLQELGIAAPSAYLTPDAAMAAVDSRQISLPLVVKPRWGTTSLGVEVVHDPDELDGAYRLLHRRLRQGAFPSIHSPDPASCVVIQPVVEGVEFGLDIVNDLRGRHVCTFAREKLRMRAGQTDRARTIHEARFDELGRAIGTALGHVGLLDCDVIVSGDRPCVLDLNPRIGGGYPFVHLAGADYPSALVAWALGEQPPTDVFAMEPGLVFGKIDVHVPVPIDPPRRTLSGASPPAATGVSR